MLEQRRRGCIERSESIFLLVIIIIIRIATVEPYTLDSIVAFDGLRKHIGTMLGWCFCDFFFQFSLHLGKGTGYRDC